MVIYCLRHMQVARKYFNNGEKRGKSAFFRGKLKNPPPPPHISVLRIKRYGTGLAQVKIGMEAPGNRLLAVHLPVSAICVIKDKVVNKRNDWVISAVPLKDNTLIFFTNLKIIFKFLKTFFLSGSIFFFTDSIPESH